MSEIRVLHNDSGDANAYVGEAERNPRHSHFLNVRWIQDTLHPTNLLLSQLRAPFPSKTGLTTSTFSGWIIPTAQVFPSSFSYRF